MESELLSKIKNIYYEYLYNNSIVFTFTDDYIIVLLKITNTHTNEYRTDIIDLNNATYIGFNFIVLKIFNIWNPNISYSKKIIKYFDDSYLIFQENQIILKQDTNYIQNYDILDKDIIMTDIYYIYFYKTIDTVFYKVLQQYITNLNNFEGDCYEWYDNGMLYKKYNYKNGIRNGIWIKFYPSGVKTYNGKFINGNKVGNWIFYYETGEIDTNKTRIY